MTQTNSRSEGQPAAETVRVPAGVPPWITAELIQQTLRTWQPYYAAPLTLDDAVAMLLNVGRLCKVLSRKASS